MIIFANLVLLLHFCIIIFIASGFFIIPIGYYLSWHWVKNKLYRIIHLVLFCFITFQTIVVLTCPVTSVENNLRGFFYSDSFIVFWIKKLIFWNLPTIFFICLYSSLLLWTFIMWKIFPPNKNKNTEIST